MQLASLKIKRELALLFNQHTLVEKAVDKNIFMKSRSGCPTHELENVYQYRFSEVIPSNSLSPCPVLLLTSYGIYVDLPVGDLLEIKLSFL